MKRFLFVLLTLPLCAFADGGLPTQPYIYVEGKAEIEKPADMVTLRFDLVARNPDQTKANEEVQMRAAKIFALLNGRKVAQDDVIAENLRSEAEFEQSERNRGKLIGYVVTRPFAVKVRDINAYPKLVDDLIATGGAEFSGIEPELSKNKEIQDQLWDKAIANAREQAEKTLKQTGMKIDSVFAISPVTFPEIAAKIFRGTGLESVIVTGSNVRNVHDRVSSEYRVGPLTLGQNVHVIYLISPAK
jgi:uncharacterized protein YggE